MREESNSSLYRSGGSFWYVLPQTFPLRCPTRFDFCVCHATCPVVYVFFAICSSMWAHPTLRLHLTIIAFVAIRHWCVFNDFLALLGLFLVDNGYCSWRWRCYCVRVVGRTCRRRGCICLLRSEHFFDNVVSSRSRCLPLQPRRRFFALFNVWRARLRSFSECRDSAAHCCVVFRVYCGGSLPLATCHAEKRTLGCNTTQRQQ